ncbi:MAG: hypothetical protein SWJ54_23435, partial [Cyanobacteriota bacterium]|nr:hypothetical protein [Cyanobacteriota bacterium]
QAIAQYWRQQTFEEFNPEPSLPFKKTYQILLRNQQLRQELLTELEQIFVQNLVEDIMNLSSQSPKTGMILALLLYPNSTQFLSNCDLFSLSHYKDILNLIGVKVNSLWR